MRCPLSLALSLCVASFAAGDRLITIPIGRKIPFDSLKLDSFFDMRSWDRFVGFGVTADFDIDYHGEQIDHGPMRDTFDFSYNYLAPIVDQSPGLSAGVQDLLNRTRNGRRFYVATTWRQASDTIGNGTLSLELTIGVAQGSRTLPFVGVAIPFAESLRLLTEHDGYRLASGIEVRALRGALAAKIIERDQDVLIGASLTLRF